MMPAIVMEKSGRCRGQCLIAARSRRCDNRTHFRLPRTGDAHNTALAMASFGQKLFFGSILRLTKHYPLTRGRDFFFRNFVAGKSFARFLDEIPNPIRTRRGFPLFCNTADYLSHWLKVWGEYESGTEAFLLDHMRGGGTFLDVGANMGYFSLLIAD